MSVLTPIPLSVLVRRAAAELPKGSVYDLPARRIYRGFPGRDLSTRFHGHRVATPVGPAAGPHTQLAQNLALSYLAGGRVLELKTVQVDDALAIPRPCIDMRTVGYNIEWSQELAVRDSLREYAKASLLVAILAELLAIPETERAAVFDVSVGYGLEGIRSRKIAEFLEGVRDASGILAEERGALARALPRSLRRLADVPCAERLSDSVTLSTFHGCLPGEIDAIGRHLLSEGFHTVVKLNPTLLGYETVEEILHVRLGYGDVALRRPDFEKDLAFADALALARGLSAEGARRGLGFGLKLTNTLVVGNRTGMLPGEAAYLSGEPLHVLALALAVRLREALGPALPLSFSSGVDAGNVAETVACGFVPVTSCTDLLRTGGYRRLHRQVEALAAALGAAGAATLPDFIRSRSGAGPGADVAAASHETLRRAAAEAVGTARYGSAKTGTPPPKIGASLHLFDCINCDKCIPVCPNDANFFYETPARTIAYRDLGVAGGTLVPAGTKTLALGGPKAASHQIANWADACNDCGNCDVFCPEDGGPYIEKPRLFGSRDSYEADAPRPGFYVRREGRVLAASARWGGHEVELRVAPDGSAVFSDGVAELTFAAGDAADPCGTRLLVPSAPEGHVVPVGHYHALRAIAAGVLAPGAVSWPAAVFPETSELENAT